MKYFLPLFTFMMAGCVSTIEPEDITKIGKDTYQVSDSVPYTMNSNHILNAASAFCSKDSKELLLISTNVNRGKKIDSYDFVFMCLDADDPRYTEANPESNADIIIEKRTQ